MRPTVHDVARAAGVGIATVDRVLNERPGVRPATAERVKAAVDKLGFVRDASAAALARKRNHAFVFVIPQGANAFMRRLEAEAREAGQRLAGERVEIDVVSVPPFDGDALAAALRALEPEKVAGVALVATESAAVRAELCRLNAASIPVVTLVSDAPRFPRHRYVGIDNVAAGRTAASLIGQFLAGKPGKIVVVAGSMLVRDHVERRLGFGQVISTQFPHLKATLTLEGRDERDATREALKACLTREGDIVGLYNIGAGIDGILDVLSELPAEARPVVVAHELNDDTRAALEGGLIHAVINQDPGHEIRSAIRVLRSMIEGTPLIEGQEAIRIEIFLRDNLP
ncbi:LacI family DNA-binding transcriptional regulator [Pleomorphomonas sp. PLEO]|uniref:LacI family DNA-binding transcriptional regulator n=1 Tax=Pleomorphomonas sp. PLEO TaxID=3239306 RepID=UPI00351E6839